MIVLWLALAVAVILAVLLIMFELLDLGDRARRGDLEEPKP